MQLTSGPDFVGVSSTIFPAMEKPLHVAIKIVLSRFNQCTIVVHIKPTLEIGVVISSSPAYDNAAIRPWYQIVILSIVEAQDVIVGEQNPLRANYPAAYSFHWHYLVSELWNEC